MTSSVSTNSVLTGEFSILGDFGGPLHQIKDGKAIVVGKCLVDQTC